MRVCALSFSKIEAKNTSTAYVKAQKIPFQMVLFYTIELICNLRSFNSKYANFESKSSKIDKKVVDFKKFL